MKNYFFENFYDIDKIKSKMYQDIYKLKQEYKIH